MQTITFPKYQPGQVGKLAVRLYRDASINPLFSIWSGYPQEAEDIIACLMRGAQYRMDRLQVLKAAKVTDNSRAIVGFSGGKDSTAVALKLKAEGITPLLFHVKGINPAYPGERQAAENVAASIGAKMLVLEVKRSGKCAHIENPAKNQVILGFMVDYGQRHGIGIYGQGGTADEECGYINFSAGYSDGREMFWAADRLYGAALDGYTYRHGMLKNDTDSLLTLLQHSPGTIGAIQSCMMPVRYKGQLIKRNTAKHGVKLLPGRCGSCYKCALEYLHYSLAGFLPWSDGFAEHCVRVIHNSWQTTRGAGVYPVAEVLEYFDLSLLPQAANLKRFF